MVGVSIQTSSVRGPMSSREALGPEILGVMRDDAVRPEDALEQAIGAAVKVGGGDHFVAVAEDREHGGRRGQARGKGERRLAPLDRGQAGFERGAGRVAAPRILIAFVLGRALPA